MERRQFARSLGALVGAGAVGSAQAQAPANAAPRFGNPIPTELSTDASGAVKKTPGVRTTYTRCFTCNNICGIRARVDEKTDAVLRVAGNPYCEVNSGGDPLPLTTPVKQSYQMLTGDAGLTHRATTCGKGAAGIGCVDDPRRVTQVLKRAGKRGEGKWTSISYEQALKEIVEGGDLFGEGRVEGLRAIRRLDQLAVPEAPEFGSKANQLFATYNEEDTLRGNLYARFFRQAYGTSNLGTKHAYCGAGVGIGFALGIGPEISAGANDIDWNHFEFGLFLGTSPGSSGASINRLGRGLADARVGRKAKYVCVDPILRTTVANDTQAQWLGIKPGTDSAFLFALVQVMLARGWYDAKFLSLPSEARAKAAGEVNYSNASHLVVVDPRHPQHHRFARAADFGLGGEGAVVLEGGKLVAAAKAKTGELLVDRVFKDKSGQPLRLVSSLAMLKREADRTPLEQYSAACGIEVEAIVGVARELSHHGRKAAVVTNTGNHNNDAVMVGWLIAILNNLIAAHDAKGGAIYGAGGIFGLEGPYDLSKVEHGVNIDGVVNACRAGNYEDSSEYKRKLAARQNPYPASSMWRSMFPGYSALNAAEELTAQANGDPYRAKALINWRSNVLYSAASISSVVERNLADPSQLPLFVAIDCYMNETNRYADYFIPDRVMFEEYGCDRSWGAFMLSVAAGAPLVTPRTPKTAAGQHVCMEQFLIDLALAMDLPGFGKGAIPTADGRKVDLLVFEDWHARYLANAAAQCARLPKVSDEDREWAGLAYSMQPLRPRLRPQEAAKVEALLSRGGYYEKAERYEGDFIKGGGGKFLQFYNAAMVALRHCHSGENYPGVPVYQPPRMWNGDTWEKHWPKRDFPLLFSSYKPTLRSNYSVAYDRCVEVTPRNFVYMNTKTAAALGLKKGDPVRIVSGNGVPAAGELFTDLGVAEGAVCVSHGFGHRAFGADARVIDGKPLPALARRGGGTAVNSMIPHDPTRPGKASMLNDYYAGVNCRQGIPVRVEKLGK